MTTYRLSGVLGTIGNDGSESIRLSSLEIVAPDSAEYLVTWQRDERRDGTELEPNLLNQSRQFVPVYEVRIDGADIDRFYDLYVGGTDASPQPGVIWHMLGFVFPEARQVGIYQVGGPMASKSDLQNIAAGNSTNYSDLTGPLANDIPVLLSSIPFVSATEHDQITGSASNNTYRGGLGNDSIDGAAGNDRLSGNLGNDMLRGGTGRDTLQGGTGHDSMDGGSGADRLMGGRGKDTLSGGTGNDTIGGGTEADTLMGRWGAD